MDSLSADDHQRSTYSAHAFNNYLFFVNSMIELVQRKLTPQGDGEIIRWLDLMKRETNRMMITARGVLTSTPDALPPLLSEPASLADIAESVCVVYRDVARHKRVKIECKGPATRDRVLTDRVAAAAVLDNLMSNAVKYSQVGTAISVTTAIRHAEVVCSVIDHGPGISEADQAPTVPTRRAPVRATDCRRVVDRLRAGHRVRTGESAGWAVVVQKRVWPRVVLRVLIAAPDRTLNQHAFRKLARPRDARHLSASVSDSRLSINQTDVSNPTRHHCGPRNANDCVDGSCVDAPFGVALEKGVHQK
jgi:hypothetical protein